MPSADLPPDLVLSGHNTWPKPGATPSSSSDDNDIEGDGDGGCTVLLRLEPGSNNSAPLSNFQLRDVSVIEHRRHVYAEHAVSNVVVLGHEEGGGGMVVMTKGPREADTAQPQPHPPPPHPVAPVVSTYQDRRRRSTLSTIVSTSSGRTRTDVAKVQSDSRQHVSSTAVQQLGDNLQIAVGEGGGEHQGGQHNLDIEDKILQRKEMAHLFQWYYPEGGWGWVVVFVAAICQALGPGMWHYGHPFPLTAAVKARFRKANNETVFLHDPNLHDVALGCLVASSFGTSMFLSPLLTWFCQRRSARLTGCVGGISLALGGLFTSFATQFHHMFFSYGIMTGLGVGMVRDSATIMLNQYFKRRRALVEVFFAMGNGVGILLTSPVIFSLLRLYNWRIGLQCVAALMVSVSMCALFYRSATLYHPQRRAILHLKSQKRSTLSAGPGGNSPENISDLKSYRSRRLHTVIAAAFVSSFGTHIPLLYLFHQGRNESASDLQWLQFVSGSSWLCGSVAFGYLSVQKPSTCRISKSNLCQISLAFLAATIAGVVGEPTAIWTAAVYSFFLAGYLYIVKTLLLDLCKARHFGLAHSATNCLQAVGISVSVPLSAVLDAQVCDGAGSAVSAGMILLAAIILFVGDICQARKGKGVGGGPDGSHQRGCPQRQLQEEAAAAASDDDEEEEEEDIPATWLDVYHARFTSPDAMAEWQKLEGLLFNTDQQLNPSPPPQQQHLPPPATTENVAVQLHENKVVFSEYEQNLIKAREELGLVSSAGGGAMLRQQRQLHRQNSDSMTSSSTTDKSSSSSNSNVINVTQLMAGPNQMLGISCPAAALSAAMLTASASIHNKPAPLTNNRSHHRSFGLQYQRSIPTVIEEC